MITPINILLFGAGMTIGVLAGILYAKSRKPTFDFSHFPEIEAPSGTPPIEDIVSGKYIYNRYLHHKTGEPYQH